MQARTRGGWAWLLLAPSSLVLLGFFVAPVIVIGVLGMTGSAGGRTSVSTEYLRRLAVDPYYQGVALHTLAFAAVVTVLSLVFGYPVAYYLARSRGRVKGILLFLLVSPLLVGVVVRSFGWMVLLGSSGLVNSLLLGLGLITTPIDFLYSWSAVVVAVLHVLVPFMILSIASVLEGLDPVLEEAAMTLGATPWRTFTAVVLPLSLHGVITGCTLVFTLTLGGFATVLLLGGSNTMVLALLAYQYVTTTLDEHFASAVGLVLLVLALGVLWLGGRVVRAEPAGRG